MLLFALVSSSVVNHALFITTFTRSMEEGEPARKGYERLVATGRVPGDKKAYICAANSKNCVRSWREAAGVLDSGMASVLDVPPVGD